MHAINRLITVSCVFILFSFSLPAQEFRHIVRISPWPVLTEFSDYLSYISFRSQASLSYEHACKKMHPYLKVSYIGPKQFSMFLLQPDNNSKYNYQITGYGIGLGNRFYLEKNLQNFYLAPEFNFYDYKKHKLPADGLLTFTKEFHLSVQCGKQWTKKSGFTIDLYGGAGIIIRRYREIIEESDIQTAEYAGAGIRPSLGINLGYAF